MCRVLHRMDGLLTTVATEAMEVTQVVCSAQNVIRKKFVSDLKRSMSDALQVKKDWQQVIVQLTHERSQSHFCLFALRCFYAACQVVANMTDVADGVFELTEVCGMIHGLIQRRGNWIQQKVLVEYDVVCSTVTCA